MKKIVLFVILVICGVSPVFAGSGGGTQVEVAADGLIQFDPPQAISCIAVRVDVPAGKMVTGLRWYNGTSSEAFPNLLVASGNEFAPPPYAAAIVIAEDVQGQERLWSEVTFTNPVASQSGTLFVLLQYPENYSPQPGEEVLGVGYANEESEHHFFVTGDSSRWIKVSMNCRVLLDPVLADRVPGVVTLRAEEEHPEEEPVQELGIFAAPNPFNPATRIELYLPRATKGNVKVFDIRGRLVKELFSGELAQGNISFVWRGKDGYGRSMASGAYYVKVATGNGSFTQKLLLIK